MTSAASELARLEISTVVVGADKADRDLAALERRNERVERAVERRRRAEERAARDLVRNLQAYRQAARAIEAVAAANRALGSSGATVVTSFNRQRAAAASLATQLRQLEARENAYRAAVVKTNAQVAGFGSAANNNTRAIGAQGAAARRAANDNAALGAAFLDLRSILVGLGIGRLAGEFISTADTAKLLEGRLKQVVASEEELAAVQEELFAISQRTRSSYEGTVTLFQRVARSADQLGKSQADLLQFTELVQKAIISSGASSQEAAAGVIQLSQALASGKLGGDEFRSVIENLPAVAKAAGDGLNKMGLTAKTGVAALLELRDAGKLTATNFIEAFFLMRESIDRDFSKVPQTVGQAMTVLGNELILAIAGFDKTTNVTQKLSEAIVGLAGNLSTLGQAVSGIAAGAEFLALVNAGSTLGRVLLALGAALATVTGAVIAVGVALVAGITYLVAFRDEIKLSADGLITLGDYADVAFAKIREAIETLEPVLGDLFSPEKAQRDLAAAVEFVGAAFATARGWVIAFVDAVINAFRIVSPVVAAAGSAISAALAAAFGEGLRLAVAFRQDLGEVMDGDLVFDKLAAAAEGSFGRINDAATAEFAGLADKITDIWSSSPTTEALGQVPNPITGLLEEWREQARLIRETKDLLTVWGVEINKVGVSTTAAAKATASLTKEQKKALQSAAESIDDLKREAEAAERLAEATSKGALAVADENLAHKKAEAVHKIRQALKHADLKITEKQIAAIEEYIDRTEKANRTTAGREIVRDLDLEIEKQKELAEAYTQGEDAVRKVNEAYEIRERLTRANVAADSDLGRQIADTVRQLGEQEKATKLVEASVKELTNFFDQAFDRIGNAITEAFAKGEISALNFGDIARAVLSEVIQFALKLAVINPVKNWIAGTNDLPTLGTVFGAAGAGAAGSSGGAAGGSANFFSPITNAISSGFSGVSDFLFGTAAVDLSGGIGAITTAGTPGLFGTFGAGASTFAAAAPWIAAAAAIAIPLLSGMFAGPPSVGETSVARVTDLSRPEDAVFTFDNGGSDTSVLTGVIKAVSEAIKSGTERFLGTLRPGAGFDFSYFPSPESGNSQAAGINVKAIVDNVLEDRDRFKGLSEQEAVDKATLIALQEMVDYQSATLDEIAKNSDAATSAELIADLQFGQNFDRLTAALDALGGTVDANSLAVAQNTVARQAAADEFRTANVDPIADGLEKAIELFPGLATGDVTTTRTVRGVNVPTDFDEGAARGTRFVAEGSDEFDRLVSEGARVVTQIEEITTAATGRSANFAENLGRVSDAIAIAKGSVDLLVQSVTGEFEPALTGPFSEALAQGTANLRAAAPGFEAVNDQIREAYEQFPELADSLGPLNDVLIDVTDTIDTAIDTLRAQLKQDFEDNLQARRNAATGLGGINDIQDLIKLRESGLVDAAAVGSDPSLVHATFGDELRSLLSGADIETIGRIIASGQITDQASLAILNTMLNEKALAAVRETELAGLQELHAETKAFATAAGDNARALRNAADGLAVNEDLSILSPFGRLEEARRQFEEAYAVANDADPTDDESQRAINRLPTLSEQLLTASKAYYSTNSQYVEDYTRVQDALAATAVRQESIEQQMLGKLGDIEAAIIANGGVVANDNRSPAEQAADNGLNFGYEPERNERIYNALVSAGLPTPEGFGGNVANNLGDLRAANPAVDALVRAMGYADGGMVAGGVPGRDSVLAALTPGERVLTVDQNAIFERMAATLDAWAPIVSELRALREDFAEAANDSEELNDKVERLITVTYSTGSATAEGVRQGNEQRGRMANNADRESAKPMPRKLVG